MLKNEVADTGKQLLEWSKKGRNVYDKGGAWAQSRIDSMGYQITDKITQNKSITDKYYFSSSTGNFFLSEFYETVKGFLSEIAGPPTFSTPNVTSTQSTAQSYGKGIALAAKSVYNSLKTIYDTVKNKLTSKTLNSKTVKNN
jgi:hypothetical protein